MTTPMETMKYIKDTLKVDYPFPIEQANTIYVSFKLPDGTQFKGKVEVIR